MSSVDWWAEQSVGCVKRTMCYGVVRFRHRMGRGAFHAPYKTIFGPRGA
jgi:hypothetical protein